MPPRIQLLAHLRPQTGNSLIQIVFPSSRLILPGRVAGPSELGPRLYSRLRTPRPPPFPTVASCPPASCACAPTPELPPGVEIDRSAGLNGAVAGYAEQVLVCTGRGDWAARIEDEDGGENLAASLRGLFGRGGEFCDPYHNVSILNSSFPSDGEGTAAYLLPSFKFIPGIAHRDQDALRALAKAHILPRTLHPAHDGMPQSHRDRLVREDEEGGGYVSVLAAQDVRDVMVLICGHGGRDVRCGVMGPVLRDEFARALGRLGYAVERGGFGGEKKEEKEEKEEEKKARVGLVSHVGGHKFAGNVIIYIPPGHGGAGGPERGDGDGDGNGGSRHALAGCGIWYGRVEPRHVQGLVEETVGRGNVVADHFRGGIDSQRRMLRM